MSEQLSLFDPAQQPIGKAAHQAADILPPKALEIRDLVGEEALVRLVLKFGGTLLRFPGETKNLDNSVRVQKVAEEIGDSAARILAAHYGAAGVLVPRCYQALLETRDRIIVADLDADVPAPVLALRWEMTERNVWKIAKRGRRQAHPPVATQPSGPQVVPAQLSPAADVATSVENSALRQGKR